MKRILVATLTLALVLGCFGGSGVALADGNQTVNVGWVVCLDEEISEEEKYAAENYPDSNIQMPDGYEMNVLEFETINELTMAFAAGKIDALNASLDTIEYIVRRHPEYEDNLILEEPYDINFVMALLPGKEALRDDLNRALNAMIEDGTRDRFIQKWISESGGDTEPQAIELPRFDGAPTIRVGITGDVLPMDYVAIDGTPAGFNTDVLCYIANYLQVNIEMVPLTAAARMIAMSQERVDVVFWFMDFILDTSDTVITTVPYHASPLANLCSDNLRDAILSAYSEEQILGDE